MTAAFDVDGKLSNTIIFKTMAVEARVIEKERLQWMLINVSRQFYCKMFKATMHTIHNVVFPF